MDTGDQMELMRAIKLIKKEAYDFLFLYLQMISQLAKH